MPRKPNKSCNVAIMKQPRHKKGSVVRILHSPYAGVNVGDLGKVDGQHADEKTKEPGYGVEFQKVWPQTYINEKPVFQKRVMWFPVDAVEWVPSAELEKAVAATEKK